MDERQLIAKILAGDADAERQLYDAHDDRVYRLAYRMTREGDLFCPAQAKARSAI